MNSSALTGKQ